MEPGAKSLAAPATASEIASSLGVTREDSRLMVRALEGIVNPAALSFLGSLTRRPAARGRNTTRSVKAKASDVPKRPAAKRAGTSVQTHSLGQTVKAEPTAAPRSPSKSRGKTSPRKS